MNLEEQALIYKESEYNRAVDAAVSYAMAFQAESWDGKSLTMNAAEVAACFDQALAVSLFGTPQAEQKAASYVPILFLAEEAEITDLRTEETRRYLMPADSYVIAFTLNEWITVYRKTGELAAEGYYQDILPFFPCEEILQHFDAFRRSCILNTILHFVNLTLTAQGISHMLDLAGTEGADHIRTIDDITLLAVIRGLPLNTADGKTYERVALGGARLYKTKGDEYDLWKLDGT